MAVKKKIVCGIFDTTEWYDRILAYMPHASAGVNIGGDGTFILRSYKTNVVEIDPEGWLTCSGTYSATTRKHIGAFLKEYAPNIGYYAAKQCYEDGIALNIHTGEIKPLAEYYAV